MIEIFLLAGAISAELEPYAVENPESDTYGVETGTSANGGSFQWTTGGRKSGNSRFQETNELNGDGVQRDAFGRPIEVEE